MFQKRPHIIYLTLAVISGLLGFGYLWSDDFLGKMTNQKDFRNFIYSAYSIFSLTVFSILASLVFKDCPSILRKIRNYETSWMKWIGVSLYPIIIIGFILEILKSQKDEIYYWSAGFLFCVWILLGSIFYFQENKTIKENPYLNIIKLLIFFVIGGIGLKALLAGFNGNNDSELLVRLFGLGIGLLLISKILSLSEKFLNSLARFAFMFFALFIHGIFSGGVVHGNLLNNQKLIAFEDVLKFSKNKEEYGFIAGKVFCGATPAFDKEVYFYKYGKYTERSYLLGKYVNKNLKYTKNMNTTILGWYYVRVPSGDHYVSPDNLSTEFGSYGISKERAPSVTPGRIHIIPPISLEKC